YQDKAKADAAAEDGRFDFNTALTAATTLYAGWEQNVVENPVAITITLHANGGLFEDETDTATYTVENVDEFDPDEDFPYFERTGYDFVGWYTDADCTEAWDGTVSEGLKLWADWEAVEFAVEFNANGGTFPIDATKYIAEKYAGETLTEQEVASITEPTRYGYDFAGWFLDEQGETAWDFSATLTGVEVFYAKWTKKTGLVQEDYVGENLNFNEFPAYMTNYEFAGEIDGEEVTFTIIGFDCDEDGNVVSSSKILWEGHVINIKSIDFSWGETTITAEIDGVDVKIILQDNLDFLTLTIEREGYEDIELSYWPYL
ncbi:MAG: InlB B-repeat-containing protein, partial [Clostridiales bacterium]|nr:InlB B-repeat-containing protein [Clostridiales bacterium]